MCLIQNCILLNYLSKVFYMHIKIIWNCLIGVLISLDRKLVSYYLIINKQLVRTKNSIRWFDMLQKKLLNVINMILKKLLSNLYANSVIRGTSGWTKSY